MATVYIKPGTGTGTGTLSDPYFYSQLATAETAAGSGGTILFTDGTYTASSFSFDENGVNYKSLNPLGATLEGTAGALRAITLGHYSLTTASMSIENFVISNCRITAYLSTAVSEKHTIKGNKLTASLSSAALITSQGSNTVDLLNNSFNIDFNAGSALSSAYNKGTISGNTFYVDTDRS